MSLTRRAPSSTYTVLRLEAITSTHFSGKPRHSPMRPDSLAPPSGTLAIKKQDGEDAPPLAAVSQQLAEARAAAMVMSHLLQMFSWMQILVRSC